MYCSFNGIDCEYANKNGYCDSTACHNNSLLSNIVPKEQPQNLSNKSVWSNLHSNWYTGKPTEEGYYVLTFPNELGFPDYCVGYWNGEKFLIRDAWEGKEVEFIAWQKIEPYKETDNECK